MLTPPWRSKYFRKIQRTYNNNNVIDSQKNVAKDVLVSVMLRFLATGSF